MYDWTVTTLEKARQAQLVNLHVSQVRIDPHGPLTTVGVGNDLTAVTPVTPQSKRLTANVTPNVRG